jgi:hypothetical protein
MSDALTPEELHRIINRNQFSLQVLADRVGNLTRENVELLSIVQELQDDLAEAHQALAELKSSGDLLAQLASDHGDVHAVSDDEAGVPGG